MLESLVAHQDGHIVLNRRKLSKGKARGVGGDSHMTGVGMLVVSLRGVNLGFWSLLGCCGEDAIIFSREDLV